MVLSVEALEVQEVTLLVDLVQLECHFHLRKTRTKFVFALNALHVRQNV